MKYFLDIRDCAGISFNKLRSLTWVNLDGIIISDNMSTNDNIIDIMKELKGKPVKFTFVSVDAKDDWNTKVSDFADEYDLRKNVVLFDASMISPDYFTKITKTWDGGSIPFTVIKKGDKEVENVGMMSKEDLDAKLNSFK